MASEWVSTRLGDIIRVKHGWAFKSPEFDAEWERKPIVISVGNFRYTGGFRFSETTTRGYRGAYPKEFELSPGDILLVMTCQTAGGEILGIPARVPNDGRTYLHNQRLGKVVVLDEARVDPDYIYWLFLWDEFNRELVASASGTKILHTAPSRIEDFSFDLPPLSEQHAIANILGTLDHKIELNRRLSETLEAMARALFKSWFVDFDPVRAKIEGRDPGLPKHIADLFPDRLVDSELGEIPEGWEVKSLDQIAHFQNGLALQKYRPQPGGERLPVVKIAQLRSGKADSDEWATANLTPKCIIDDGDVVFSWSGSLIVRVWCGGRAALNQHLFKVTSEDYPRWFFLEAILSHLAEFRQIAAGKATTMGHIQRRHLADARCVVPGNDLLTAACPLFSVLVDRGILIDVQNRQHAELRDTLLPKLISGELRVKDAEKFMESVP
ncbi:restriction endonuclease subunit S [Lentisalinibacter sediminis]|uniref:restriction endonuclease subunit S n=1 Tax=Lentisalinibacter sediminis TaxID=2992237 RepID=UPI00387021D1